MVKLGAADLLFVELCVKSGDEGREVRTDKEEWLWLIAGICHQSVQVIGHSRGG